MIPEHIKATYKNLKPHFKKININILDFFSSYCYDKKNFKSIYLYLLLTLAIYFLSLTYERLDMNDKYKWALERAFTNTQKLLETNNSYTKYFEDIKKICRGCVPRNFFF